STSDEEMNERSRGPSPAKTAIDRLCPGLAIPRCPPAPRPAEDGEKHLLEPGRRGPGQAVVRGTALRNVEGPENPIQKGKGHGVIAKGSTVAPIAMVGVMDARRHQDRLDRTKQGTEAPRSPDGVVPAEMGVGDQIP